MHADGTDVTHTHTHTGKELLDDSDILLINKQRCSKGPHVSHTHIHTNDLSHRGLTCLRVRRA